MNYLEYVLGLQNVKHDKNKKLIYLFSVSKPVMLTNSLKTLDCVAPIPLETFFSQQ